MLNRRYKKTTSSESTNYIYSNENILQEVKSNSGTISKKDYINGLGTDNLIAYDIDNTRYYYHKDHLGSIVGITDNSGNSIVEYDYDVYGSFTSTGTDIGNDRLFTGREYDSEIGLYYNRARYYNPELGRFISRDPIDISDDINLYSYVGNNPVNYGDPSGEVKQAIIKSVGDTRDFIGGLMIGGLDIMANISIGVETANSPGPNDIKTSLNKTDYSNEIIMGVSLIGLGKGKIANKVENIAENITKKYGLFKCKECALELGNTLKKEGIEFEKIILKGGYKDRIYSEMYGDFISTNGYHEAIKIGDKVYDNIFKKGIGFKDFIDDLSVGTPNGPTIFK